MLVRYCVRLRLMIRDEHPVFGCTRGPDYRATTTAAATEASRCESPL
jgi:hypothetical protein